MRGINGTNAHAAIYNADSNLKGILDALKQWGLADTMYVDDNNDRLPPNAIEPYAGGWFYKIKLSSPAELNALLTPEQYQAQIAGV